jgi:hypothetical protein
VGRDSVTQRAPYLPIADALRQQGFSVDLVSSGTGAEFLRSHAVPHVDLGYDDRHDLESAATKTVTAQVLRGAGYDAIITDEVMQVPAVCAALGLTCVALSCFTGTDDGQAAWVDHAFAGASLRIIPDWPAVHRTGTVPYVFTGPIVAPIEADRAGSRIKLRIPVDSFVGVCSTGGLRHSRVAVQCQVIGSAIEVIPSLAGIDRQLVILAARSSVKELTGTAPTLVGNVKVSYVGGGGAEDLFYSAADVVFSAPGTSASA